MKRNLRSHSRIDYKVLNSTGEKITKVISDNVEELSELLDNISIEDSMDKVLVEESTLSDDIRAKRAKEITSENESNERTVLFIIKEARRIILEIQSEFKKDFNNIDNVEIIRRKAEFSENIKKVENVSKRFQQILQSKFTTRHIDDEVTNLTKMYEKLFFNKDMYEIQLKKEVEIRELEKHNLFKEANLNIKLCKFKGYGSDIDIYSLESINITRM